MTGNFVDDVARAARTAAEKAVDLTGALVERGREKLDRISLENELAKAQRQLGALVYSLKKAGEENPALVDRYIQDIAELEKKLNEKEAAEAERYCVSICPACGAQVGEDAGFCAHCGVKLG